MVDRGSPLPSALADRRIPDLASLLRPGDLLVLNDTRVRPASLYGLRAATGGKVEALLIEQSGQQLRLQLGTRGRLQSGEALLFAEGRIPVTLEHPEGQGAWTASTPLSPSEFRARLEESGRLPLPPYIRRDRAGDPRDALDRERYQTVYARHEGAAAAPTAGLHLTPAILGALPSLGVALTTVTLHVGPGTFRPVTCPDLREHPMHEEAYDVPAEAAEAVRRCRAAGGRIVPVGTTSVRVLEAACDEAGHLTAGAGRTRLFIHEPWRFRLVDALLTNFHAPRSTLLMLVAAFAGRERTLAAYHHAIRAGYRLLSYGDAMFIA